MSLLHYQAVMQMPDGDWGQLSQNADGDWGELCLHLMMNCKLLQRTIFRGKANAFKSSYGMRQTSPQKPKMFENKVWKKMWAIFHLLCTINMNCAV
uniref:Uncharacterized protein n=1 Tax=Arundo donax TaxID=35708 RepID=A0A0A9EY66_ARUDO